MMAGGRGGEPEWHHHLPNLQSIQALPVDTRSGPGLDGTSLVLISSSWA